jgi:hypothetical protein
VVLLLPRYYLTHKRFPRGHACVTQIRPRIPLPKVFERKGGRGGGDGKGPPGTKINLRHLFLPLLLRVIVVVVVVVVVVVPP